MSGNTEAFLKILRHPFKFRVFLFSKLPAAYFAGVRVRQASTEKCVASVPYKWLSQNPFRSTYFACLSMAAELSTGALAMTHLYKIHPPVSMLVVKVESEYFKKANTRTYFTCEDGNLFAKAIADTIATGESTTVKARSVGKNKEGDVVAEFYITWSFKARSKK
jgi:hypothetical protein